MNYKNAFFWNEIHNLYIYLIKKIIVSYKMVRYQCPMCNKIDFYEVEPTKNIHLRNGIKCKHCNDIFFNQLKHTVPTPLIPLGTQLFGTETNNTLPSVSDLNNNVQQQIVYLKRYPDIKIDPYGYQNDYYFTMNKSDWKNNYKNLQDYNTEIRHPIYYNNEEYTIQRLKRGDLMNQFDQKAIQHYKKTGKRLPRKGF
jgi:hypothetical protein